MKLLKIVQPRKLRTSKICTYTVRQYKWPEHNSRTSRPMLEYSYRYDLTLYEEPSCDKTHLLPTLSQIFVGNCSNCESYVRYYFRRLNWKTKGMSLFQGQVDSYTCWSERTAKPAHAKILFPNRYTYCWSISICDCIYENQSYRPWLQIWFFFTNTKLYESSNFTIKVWEVYFCWLLFPKPTG